MRTWCETNRDGLITVIHGNVAGITGARTDTVEWSGAAVFQTVPVAILADSVVIGIFTERTLRQTVRAISHILTAYT